MQRDGSLGKRLGWCGTDLDLTGARDYVKRDHFIYPSEMSFCFSSCYIHLFPSVDC